MKIQFDDGRIRARLGAAEFAALCDGRAVRTRLEIGGSVWSVVLAPGDSFAVAGDGPDVGITLPRGDIAELAARLPARDGLRYAVERPQGPLEVNVEVDLHDGRRRAR